MEKTGCFGSVDGTVIKAYFGGCKVWLRMGIFQVGFFENFVVLKNNGSLLVECKLLFLCNIVGGIWKEYLFDFVSIGKKLFILYKIQ